ncbi:hypothetical protein KUTeg_004155 [Tegillarca granosa]|uniref:Uncharacterized protein n=1 Tax=Tegillarca granosa TaxID=220873 RepID=A0ABQ9FP61_TEGGR|nr:hypothetical protein KUTeg_004155 [Tegillarca granosa]
MGTPRCNREILSKLPRQSQTRDTQLQEIQKSLALGLTTFASLVEKICTLDNFMSELRPLCCDSMSLIGNAFNKYLLNVDSL